MQPPAIPPNEAERLAALNTYRVLDTPAEPGFDANLGHSRQSGARLEPDPVCVDDADGRDRHAEGPSSQRRDAVESAVRWRVENVVSADDRKPL